ncbi:hypothetical protein HK102_010598 [Quaeritorhiza haematococci]|nr:hypothetical protein HK102_010598 [Quaeritorhiza haematococci]
MHILLDYYELYQSEGLDNPPDTLDNATKEWIQDNDVVTRFIEDRCVFRDTERVHRSSPWDAYQSWKLSNPDISGHFNGKLGFYGVIKPMLKSDSRVITKDTKIEGQKAPGVEKMGLKKIVF